MGIFEEVMEGGCGKAPGYNTVRDWVRKLGLSIYEDDAPLTYKYADVIDESITVNKEKPIQRSLSILSAKNKIS